MAKKRKAAVATLSMKRGSGCGSCPCWFSWAVLVVGVLYLFADLFPGTALAWFGSTFSWWTAAFVLIGLKKVCK